LVGAVLAKIRVDHLDIEHLIATVMKKIKMFVLASALVGLTQYLNAGVLFFDNFNSENGGVGVLNYTGFANWTVTHGAVDLIGNGFFDFYPGNGLYVDTEGSTDVGGTMVTDKSFNFVPGTTYTLSFDLGGDARGGTRSEIVTVGAGGSILDADISLGSSAPYQLFSFNFTVAAPTSSPLSFAAGEDGDVGLILDNVGLSASSPNGVPDGGNTAMLAAGALLVLAASASRSRKSAMAIN
jgi:hypothetical protein